LNVANVIALLIGLVALLSAAVAFIPFLGWANWLIIPLAVIGAGIGQISGGSKAGRNLCLLVIIVGVLRLSIGGGII
jgi:hypothetical protein